MSNMSTALKIRFILAGALLLGCAGSKGSADSSASVERPGVPMLRLPGAQFYPESLSVSGDGALYVGSITTGSVVRFASGQSEASAFLEAGGAVKGVAGVLVDQESGSLFVCAVDATFQTAPTVQRYDLTTRTLLATYSLPAARDAAPAFLNDMAFDNAHHLFVTESFGGRIYRVGDVSKSAEMTLWKSDPALSPQHEKAFGANGISWDGEGNFFLNNNDTGDVIRIAQDPDGNPGPAQTLTLTPHLDHPDGQRQLDAKTLLIADNSGELRRVALSATSGTVSDIRTGLDAPTSVVVFGNSYWVTEGQLTSSLLTGKPPNLPFTIARIPL